MHIRRSFHEHKLIFFITIYIQTFFLELFSTSQPKFSKYQFLTNKDGYGLSVLEDFVVG